MPERVVIDREIAVLTRDGVRLATDVYRPAGDAAAPTLIYRIRGSRSSAFIVGQLLLNPLDAVRRGYAVVVQEVRGRAGSESRWHPFVHEREDGEDCLRWVLDQPWCDGRIGAYGTAYSAETALALAVEAGDQVRAVAVLGTGADYHDGWVYTSGAFELGWNVYWAYMTLSESIARLPVSEEERAEMRREYAAAIIDAPGIAARLPITDHPLLRRCGEDQYHEWLEHPDYDEYWASVDVLAAVDRIAAPILSIVGWHDNFLRSHFDLYRAVTRDGREPGCSHHRLIVGPWEHVNYVSAFARGRTGAVEFGPEAACGVGFSGPLLLDWFDRWITGDESGPSAGVRYWQMGEDAWREAPRWPPPHAEQRWYFSSGGHANSSTGDGLLATAAPAAGSPVDSFLYSPLDPVPSVGGKTLMPTIAGAGIEDQRRVEERADVLCYTSAALAESVVLAGQVRVELWASSSAPDTDFTAKLVDVHPGGFAAILADGIVRARYRDSVRTRSTPLEPGQPVRFDIDLWDLAHSFPTGHRIRVEISSSNFPRFDRNMNTGHELGADGADDAVTATQQVHHEAERPSALVLPVVDE